MSTARNRNIEHELVTIVGIRAVETVADGSWLLNWRMDRTSPLRRQVQVFSRFIAGDDPVLDVEESPDDCPVPLSSIADARGIGHVCRLNKVADVEPLMNWLSRQVWLAITWVGEIPAAIRLNWSVEQFFERPRDAPSFLNSVGASKLIVSYYDGDQWLLASIP